MTDMRDARFQKALQEAPDAGARPASQVAQAIRDAARNALPAPPRPVVVTSWWQRLWQNTGRPSAPWNATFATLLVGVLVTVMWVREPVPDARPFADSAPPAAAKGESSPAPVPSPSPAAAPATATAPTPIESSRSVAAKISTAPTPAPAPIAAPATAQEPSPSKMADAVQPTAPQADRLKKDASTDVQASRAEMARAAAPAPAPAAAPAMPPAPAAVAMAPAPMVQSSADLSGLDGWTAMQVQMQGRTTTLNRAQAQKLFAGMVRQVQQMRRIGQIGQSQAASRNPAAVPATEPILRLTVVSQAQTKAVMVLWDDTVLWQRPTRDDVIASATAADVQALLQLARQSLGADAPD